MVRPRYLPDNFTLTLLSVVALATLLPARGALAGALDVATQLGIGLLFFLHGAKLSREAVVAGAAHLRLHALIFACTFGLFPLLGLLLRPVLTPLVGADLYRGLLYVCALPATVQSAIAFTSIARGNIPAAVCSAAASSLFGVFMTPLLVALLLGVEGQGGGSLLDAIRKIGVQLLLPFVLGQVARGFIGPWVVRNKDWIRYVDQGSILLVVYAAFSSAVIAGLWHQVPPLSLAGLVIACSVLLGLALLGTHLLGRALGFGIEDRITILFCGSKKSLATGVPMAQVLFAGQSLGLLLLPLMLFHQIQLMVCAALAARFAKR
ncbi:MAG: bile acid:sodium symporter [Myxococcales bacterium]|nr:bile acid:sodium symporter [Myxococcales bacterium]